MSTANYDDQLLEVATELELTVGGDFMKIIIQKVTRPWNVPSAVAGYGLGPYSFKRSVEGKLFWHDHWETTLTLYLDVETVLHGRQVRPEDVVALLSPEAAGSRTVSLVDGSEAAAIVLNDCIPGRRYFRLTQIEPCDKRFFERLGAWIQGLATQATDPGLREEMHRRIREGLQLPIWASSDRSAVQGQKI